MFTVYSLVYCMVRRFCRYVVFSSYRAVPRYKLPSYIVMFSGRHGNVCKTKTCFVITISKDVNYSMNNLYVCLLSLGGVGIRWLGRVGRVG